MAKHGSGRYELRVEVTDIESGDVAAKETWFMVAE
jgi:hypothetical protein